MQADARVALESGCARSRGKRQAHLYDFADWVLVTAQVLSALGVVAAVVMAAVGMFAQAWL